MNNNRILFIDGSNLYATAKSLGIDIDFGRVLKHFGNCRAYYYTAIVDSEEFSTIRPLIDWLDYNSYTVVTKPTKEFITADGQRKVKGNMDVEMTVQAMELSAYMQYAVFFTGDGDFVSLIRALQRRGVHCTVVSSILTRPNPMCADELRRSADTYLDISAIRADIQRDPDKPRLTAKSELRSRYG